MSIVDKLRSLRGIKVFLEKYNYDFNEKSLNTLFLEFAQTSEWKSHFSKNNSKNYKGKDKPHINNAHLISLNCFKEFKQWFIKNKKT